MLHRVGEEDEALFFEIPTKELPSYPKPFQRAGSLKGTP